MRSPLPWLLLLALAGCDPDLPGATPDCTSTTECALDSYCRVPSRQCIQVAPDTVGGDFACTVINDGEPYNPGPSAVVGRFSSENVAFTTEASCVLYDNGLRVELLSLSGSSFNESAVSFVVDLPTKGKLTGTLNLTEPESIYGQFGTGLIKVITTAGEIPVGVGKGTLVLTGDARPGGRLTGYLESQLREVARTTRVGIPCDTVQACGRDLALSCEPVLADSASTCRASCQDTGAATCELYGGTCYKDICLRPCGDGCPQGTTCTLLDGAIEVCT